MDASTAFIIADPQLSAGLVNMGVKAVPIYEYRCDSCAHELEKIQKMNDDMLVDCPECDEPALKKLISAAAFRLKGSGWYETDFKKDNKRNLAESTNKESWLLPVYGIQTIQALFFAKKICKIVK